MVNKIFFFELSEISKYRSLIMGFAAIGILICHAPANVSCMPHILGRVMGAFGMIGNPIFFFLSGVGLFYSLDKEEINIMDWFRRRFTRLMLPYLIISIFIQFIYLLIGNCNIIDSLLYITGVSYWLHGKGSWFVWALVPLYLLSPILVKIFKHKLSYIWVIFISIAIFMLRELNEDSYTWVVSAQQVASNAPIFLLGLWGGQYIKGGKKINILLLAVIHIVLLALRFALHLHWLPMVAFAACPSLLLAYWFVLLTKKFFSDILNFFGKISLESYVLNTSLPGVLLTIPVLASTSAEPVRYLLVIIIGVALSYPVNRLANSIGTKIN